MNREIHCRCLLCSTERHLMDKYAEGQGQQAYQQIASLSPNLSSFPAASALIAYLHTEQASGNGNAPKNEILAELMRESARNANASAPRELLLLAFVPMLHRISRQVATRYPVLPVDDVSQHAVAALLESFSSPQFAGHPSHLAFGIARLLRRHVFAWAEREAKGWLFHSRAIESLELPAHPPGPQPIERGALLNHFLNRCYHRGVLSAEDLHLLVRFNLEQSADALHSNASRQRMKRLIGKLRRAAGRPRRTSDDRQLRLF